MSLPYSFRAGDTAKSAEVNENFNYLQNRVTSTASTLQASVNSVQSGLSTVSDKIANGATVAAGTIILFGGRSVPEGYLLCDGTAKSRSTYQKLYTAIGTRWGGGDGSTTFNLPNLINKYLKTSNEVGTSSDTITTSNKNLNHTHSCGSSGVWVSTGGALGDHNHNFSISNAKVLPCIKY